MHTPEAVSGITALEVIAQDPEECYLLLKWHLEPKQAFLKCLKFHWTSMCSHPDFSLSQLTIPSV